MFQGEVTEEVAELAVNYEPQYTYAFDPELGVLTLINPEQVNQALSNPREANIDENGHAVNLEPLVENSILEVETIPEDGGIQKVLGIVPADVEIEELLDYELVDDKEAEVVEIQGEEVEGVLIDGEEIEVVGIQGEEIEGVLIDGEEIEGLLTDGKDIQELMVEGENDKENILEGLEIGDEEYDYDLELIGFKGTSAEQGQSKREVRHYCQQCGNCYNAASSLKLHMRACQRPRIKVRHECEVCGKVFKSNKNLKDHMMTHMSIATYRCQRCYRKFIEEDKYVAHMQYHRHQDKLEAAIVAMNDKDRDNKVAREFKCSFCTQNFIVVFELGMVKRRYACDRCRDKFSNVEVLREHKKRAEEKPEFLCDRCGRKFVFEGFMQRHRTNCKGIINRNHNRK